MDPLVRPEFLLLLLEQGDRSLEDHTRLFLCEANTTSYPDDVLCSFYDASLNTATRALSSEDGPREDFTAFVEWTLARNVERSTPDPEPSPPSPRGVEHQPEPTDDGEPFPVTINEPAQSRATEQKIVPEVEPNTSDQVREPAHTGCVCALRSLGHGCVQEVKNDINTVRFLTQTARFVS